MNQQMTVSKKRITETSISYAMKTLAMPSDTVEEELDDVAAAAAAAKDNLSPVCLCA